MNYVFEVFFVFFLFYFILTILHSERPKLYAILAFLSAIGLKISYF